MGVSLWVLTLPFASPSTHTGPGVAVEHVLSLTHCHGLPSTEALSELSIAYDGNDVFSPFQMRRQLLQ